MYRVHSYFPRSDQSRSPIYYCALPRPFGTIGGFMRVDRIRISCFHVSHSTKEKHLLRAYSNCDWWMGIASSCIARVGWREGRRNAVSQSKCIKQHTKVATGNMCRIRESAIMNLSRKTWISWYRCLNIRIRTDSKLEARPKRLARSYWLMQANFMRLLFIYYPTA